MRPQESPGTDMVSVSRVCEVGGPPVSPRSEADTVPLPPGVGTVLNPWLLEPMGLHRLSLGFLSAAPSSLCQVPSGCGARQRVLWDLSPLCGLWTAVVLHSRLCCLPQSFSWEPFRFKSRLI